MESDTFYTMMVHLIIKSEGIINEIPEVTQEDIDNAKEQVDKHRKK